jgi:hypothetical protein
MFLHQQALAAPPLSSADQTIPRVVATLTGLNLGEEITREHALEEKIANLAHGTNLGREVGREWGLERVMRWQNNWVSRRFCRGWLRWWSCGGALTAEEGVK